MTDRTDTNGASAALAMLAAAGVDLFGADGADGQDDLFEPVTSGPLDAMPVKGKSGPQGGRPPGARNRSTDAWLSLFLSKNRAPIMTLGDLIGRDTGQLTDYLQEIADRHAVTTYTEAGSRTTRAQVSPLDVLRLQMDAAKALLPYVHKRQPVALEIDPGEGGVLVMAGFAGDADGGSGLALPLAEDGVEYQEVNDAEIAQSDDEQSDGRG